MSVPWYLMAKGKGGGYKTASGPIVSINDALAAPLRSLLVNIDPVQDLHGYDSPWPAGGGKNKFATADAVGANIGNYGLTIDVDASAETVRLHGTATWSGTANKSFRFLSVMRGGTYGNAPVTHDYTGLSFKPFLLSTNGTVGAITQVGYDANGGTMTITVTNTSGETNVDFTMQLVAYEGSTPPTTFSPYSNLCPISGWSAVNVWVKPTYDPTANPTATLQLGQTVYGGVLDVTNGVLTVDRANIASYNGETLPGKWISDRDVYAPGTTPTIGAQVVYELATPLHYPLSNIAVTTLKGENVLWADCGDVTVEYLSAGGANHDLMKLAVAFMGR